MQTKYHPRRFDRLNLTRAEYLPEPDNGEPRARCAHGVYDGFSYRPCDAPAHYLITGEGLRCKRHAKKFLPASAILDQQAEAYRDWFRRHHRALWATQPRAKRQKRHAVIIRALKDKHLPDPSYLRWQLLAELEALDDLSINSASTAEAGR